jgi:hypothetical protein
MVAQLMLLPLAVTQSCLWGQEENASGGRWQGRSMVETRFGIVATSQDRGLSDFDARHRFTMNFPFHGGRWKEGWQFAPILTLRSGNPINFKTTNTSFTGAPTLRPSVTGAVQIGYSPASNGNATYVQYIQNSSIFSNQGSAFGNLGRNAIIGPGFSNLDIALIKQTKIRESMRLEMLADDFDAFNHPNFGQPGLTIGAGTFGLLTNTRFPTGDSGSSRQLQLAMKLVF